MIPLRNPYPTDVSDDEWAFVAPYFTLLPEDAGQRTYSLCEVFNGLRWIVRAGAPWRMIPNDLPPWYVVYQQTQRWLSAGCFAALVDDLRLLLREAKGRNRQPSAAIFDSRTLQSPPESGRRAGYDGAKWRKGSKVHAAVDTLGNLLALLVTPANEQDRAHVGELAQAVQEVTGQAVELAFVDQGYTDGVPAAETKQHGIQLEVVKLPGERNGLTLWREIQMQGYTGSERTVYRHIETRHSGERSDFSQSQSSPHVYSEQRRLAVCP